MPPSARVAAAYGLILSGVYKIHVPTEASVGNRVSWRPEGVCPNWTDSAHPLRSVVVQAEKRAAPEADSCGLSKWRGGPVACLSSGGHRHAGLVSGPVPRPD